MKVEIPFRDDMKQAIIDGRKTCTSRNKRYGVIGDTFDINGNSYVLKWVSHVHLNFVAENCYRHEGFRNPYEFINAWRKIHPRKGYVPDQPVWLHEFELVK